MNWQRFHLPLLTRELIEQAGKIRTYGFRVVYTLALFLICGIFIYAEIYSRGTMDPFRILGQGRQPFIVLLVVQFFTVYIFLPAVACGTIAGEKERNTLQLLFLTRLSPWTIIFEKSLASLIPFLFLSLPAIPLFMLFYSFGGLSIKLVFGAVWCIFLAAIQTTMLSIFCSAFFRKSVSAFVMTWVMGVTMFLTPPICMEIYQSVIVRNWVAPPTVLGVRYVWFLGHFPPYLMDIVHQAGVFELALFSLPVVVTTVLLALAARWALTARAAYNNEPQRLFLRRVDRGLTLLKNFVLQRSGEEHTRNAPLPDAYPVQWRERHKTIFGVTRYQILIALGIFVLLWGGLQLAAVQRHDYARRDTLMLFHFGLWILLVLTALIRSACLISGERSSETLNVLLTTPLSNQEILRQKTAGLWQFLRILAIPCAWYVLSEGNQLNNYFGDYEKIAFWTCTFATAVIYLIMVAWIGTLLGLRANTQLKAIVSSLTVVVLWVAVPFAIIVPIIITLNVQQDDLLSLIIFFSPASIIVFNFWGELDRVGGDSTWFPIILNSMFYGFCAWKIRRYTLANLSRLLKRKDAFKVS